MSADRNVGSIRPYAFGSATSRNQAYAFRTNPIGFGILSGLARAPRRLSHHALRVRLRVLQEAAARPARHEGVAGLGSPPRDFTARATSSSARGVRFRPNARGASRQAPHFSSTLIASVLFPSSSCLNDRYNHGSGVHGPHVTSAAPNPALPSASASDARVNRLT